MRRNDEEQRAGGKNSCCHQRPRTEKVEREKCFAQNFELKKIGHSMSRKTC
jgi:hypothetical protein